MRRDRNHDFTRRVVTSADARRSRNRLLAMDIGLAALVGTALYAAIDGLSLSAAYDRDPYRPGEQSIALTPLPIALASNEPKANYRYEAVSDEAQTLELPRTVRVEPETTGTITLSASSDAGCSSSDVQAVLADVSARFGAVTVLATTQLRTAHHRPNSVQQKLHQSCRAVDFRPAPSRVREVKAYLRARPDIAAVQSYRDGVVHMNLAAAKPRKGPAR
jgi:hypothetical protein